MKRKIYVLVSVVLCSLPVLGTLGKSFGGEKNKNVKIYRSNSDSESVFEKTLDIGKAIERIFPVTKEESSKGRPSIKEIIPSYGPPGIIVTIKGKNFKTLFLPEVRISLFPKSKKYGLFVGKRARILELKDNEIIVKMPGEIKRGKFYMYVGGFFQRSWVETERIPFIVKKPKIEEIFPKRGRIKTEVIIRGKDFGPDTFCSYVFFWEISCVYHKVGR